MEIIWTYIIPLVVVLIIGLIGGRKIQFRAFCKELGEALLATEKYFGIDKPTPEDTALFKKEWYDVIKAGGNLFAKVIKATKYLRQKKI